MENNHQLSRIHNYVHGLMGREEMHALEREALDDPFLQDAIDGYRMLNGVDAKSLSLLQRRLARRVAEQARLKDRHFFDWQRLSVGLVAAVMFVSACTLIFLHRMSHRPSTEKLTEVELMDENPIPMRVRPMEGSLAAPVGGWRAFEAFVAERYPAGNPERELVVRFKIDAAGTPYDIAPQAETSDENREVLIDVLKNGPKWEGKEAVIAIDNRED